MADDPTAMLRTLMQRLADEGHKIGLQLETAAFIPSMGDGPMMMQAVFVVQPESITEPEPEKTAEELEMERQFAEIEQGFKMDEGKEEKEKIRESLRKLMEGE